MEARDELACDLPTACFVAYLSARMSLRSVFTNTAQERAFDDVVEALFRKAKASPTVSWWAMAHVHRHGPLQSESPAAAGVAEVASSTA